MNREVTPESFSQLLFSALSNAMFKFKDPFYSPECEWRMTPRDVPKGLEIKHRTTKDGREIDYVKMRLRNLKLTEVMCGLYADGFDNPAWPTLILRFGPLRYSNLAHLDTLIWPTWVTN
jgi:hypothetical protein